MISERVLSHRENGLSIKENEGGVVYLNSHEIQSK